MKLLKTPFFAHYEVTSGQSIIISGLATTRKETVESCKTAKDGASALEWFRYEPENLLRTLAPCFDPLGMFISQEQKRPCHLHTSEV